MGVVINATDPSSSLNKKAVALAYHFVREHQAGKVVQVLKIDSKENYADPLTKALPSTTQQSHYGETLPNSNRQPHMTMDPAIPEGSRLPRPTDPRMVDNSALLLMHDIRDYGTRHRCDNAYAGVVIVCMIPHD